MQDNAADKLHVLVRPGEAPPVSEMAGLGPYTRRGQTANFNVYYDNSFDLLDDVPAAQLGPVVGQRRDDVLARLEQSDDLGVAAEVARVLRVWSTQSTSRA